MFGAKQSSGVRQRDTTTDQIRTTDGEQKKETKCAYPHKLLLQAGWTHPSLLALAQPKAEPTRSLRGG
jgi:hypothetical protein